MNYQTEIEISFIPYFHCGFCNGVFDNTTDMLEHLILNHNVSKQQLKDYL